jgi:hypothetical protein
VLVEFVLRDTALLEGGAVEQWAVRAQAPTYARANCC